MHSTTLVLFGTPLQSLSLQDRAAMIEYGKTCTISYHNSTQLMVIVEFPPPLHWDSGQSGNDSSTDRPNPRSQTNVSTC